jgi:hypothetical protein
MSALAERLPIVAEAADDSAQQMAGQVRNFGPRHGFVQAQQSGEKNIEKHQNQVRLLNRIYSRRG